MAINPIGPAAVELPTPAAAPGAEAEAGFGQTLSKLMASVTSSDADANAAVSDMLSGSGEVHEAMIALQRADLTLQLTIQIRNKLVQAYQEIARMPV